MELLLERALHASPRMDVPQEEKASISNQMGAKKTREETNLHNWWLASKHEDKGTCSRIWKVSLILLALNSLNLSAQSPPCNRKALPQAVSSSLSSKLLASPVNTDGGELFSVFRTPSSACSSVYVGCCRAVLDFQLSRDHQHLAATPPFSPAAAADDALFFTGSAACTTFTSLLHAEELSLDILAIGILVATDDKIGLSDESCCVNFEEEEQVFSNPDVHNPWLATTANAILHIAAKSREFSDADFY